MYLFHTTKSSESIPTILQVAYAKHTIHDKIQSMLLKSKLPKTPGSRETSRPNNGHKHMYQP